MSLKTINLPTLLAAATSANSFTQSVGGLDDARSLTFFMVSTAAAASSGTGLQLQVSPYDPIDPNIALSTAWYLLSTAVFSSGTGLVTSSGYAITIATNMVSWRSLRLAGLTSATANEKIAYLTKQIEV